MCNYEGQLRTDLMHNYLDLWVQRVAITFIFRYICSDVLKSGSYVIVARDVKHERLKTYRAHLL